jgi:hypothetical protein
MNNVNLIYTYTYKFEIWSLTLREVHRLRVLDGRGLRKMFGTKRKEMAGGWRRLHSEELHKLPTSPNLIGVRKSRTKTWVGHLARTGQLVNAYRIFVGKSAGKRLLGRPRRRWEDNIGMDLREIGR